MLVFVEQVVGYWKIRPVPATPIAALIATEQQDRFTLTIEGEQHSYFGETRRTGSQFLHVRVTTRRDRVDERPTQHRTFRPEHSHGGKQRFRVKLIE